MIAATALRTNLQLRAAAFEVAVAQAQLARARGEKMPQAVLSGSYTRMQEQTGQTISFPNPFGVPPSTITATLPAPDPDQVVLRLSLQYPRPVYAILILARLTTPGPAKAGTSARDLTRR